jgi:mannose-6-phosphate isomerase-like protein (cupin superfamily)
LGQLQLREEEQLLEQLQAGSSIRVSENDRKKPSPRKGRNPFSFQWRSSMATQIPGPTRVQAVGNKPKIIEEFVGRVNSGTEQVSIARMRSPGGWVEPGQTPQFDEYTVVLNGALQVRTRDAVFEVPAGQAFIAHKGEWVQYSTPGEHGAEYVAVCLPAFSPQTVHRDP